MASFDLPILNAWSNPDTNPNTYFEGLKANFATAAVVNPIVLAYAGQSSREGIEGRFRVPQNYVGTPSLVVELAATATGNKVVIDFEYNAVGTTETFNPGSMQSTADTIELSLAGTVARDRLTGNTTLAGANFAANDEVYFRLLRDGANTSDTYAGTVWCFNAIFRYQDT